MTKIKDIIREIEKFAPKCLQEDYDNVGLMVGDDEKEVKRVLLSLDCTNDAIEEAANLKCDFMITHHPLFFRKPKRIVKKDLLGNKVINLIKEDITLYSCHTNLDSAKDGINETIVKMLGFNSCITLEPNEIRNYKEDGIGRLVKLDNPISLNNLVDLIKKTLNINNMRIVKGSEMITTLAIINGSGQDLFPLAKSFGADCIITGDTTYHFALDYKEMGISIIDAGHFSTEYLAFLKTLEFLKKEFNDVEFITSKTCQDPYEFT